MRGFASGLIVGGCMAAAAMIGFAYGQASQEPTYEDPAMAELLGQCRVRVGFGRTTFGDSCFGDEVMVGRRGDNILCADIAVSCD